MENKVERSVILRTRDGKTSQGKAFIQSWSRQERLRRSLKFLGLSWLFAILSIFLPIAHFFLVPAFFLAGPIAAYYVSRQESVVLGGESVCPNCLKTLPIARSPNKWPLDDLCSLCQTHVTVTLADLP